MIKEALEFLAKIQTPKNPIITTVDGRQYTIKPDGTLGDLIRKPDYSALEMRSLSAIAGAFKAGLDDLDPALVAFHVVDPWLVELISLEADEVSSRHVFARARHEKETDFEFDTFYAPEQFIIKFRASFYFNDQAAKVQQLCSTLQAGSTVSVSDDGISQAVTVQSGTINKASITLPAEGVPLIPWRTFREASPVESKFLLRMKADKVNIPSIALFEIDEKWKLETVHSIRDFLRGLVAEPTPIFD